MIQILVDKGLFRNINHAIWFFCTVVILFVVLIQRIFPHYIWTVLAIGLLVHLSPIVNATIVAVKKEKSDLYTKDCIVYNAIMIGLYISAYILMV